MALAQLALEKAQHIDQTLENMASELRSASPNLTLVNVALEDLKASHGADASASQRSDFQLLIDELNIQAEAAKMANLL